MQILINENSLLDKRNDQNKIHYKAVNRLMYIHFFL